MQIKRIMVSVLSLFIIFAGIVYIYRQMVITYDILVAVYTPGSMITKGYDTYYEINSERGITNKVKKIPGKYYINANVYNDSMSIDQYDHLLDHTDYSYVKQYDPLIYYPYGTCVANIHGYLYYFRTDDNYNYYRFSIETHEIKQISIGKIDGMILGENRAGTFPWINILYSYGGVIEKMGYFDYYQGLNEVMMKYISYDDYMRPYATIDYITQSDFLYDVTEVNGRLFFNSGNKLFEFYPDTNTAKYITTVKGRTDTLSGRFRVIGTTVVK